MPLETVYKAYEDRWKIEIVMLYYKSACEFDETRVQDDYSVIGSEFCDFLATTLTFRLLKAFEKAKLLYRMTYRKVMETLKIEKKIRLSQRGMETCPDESFTGGNAEDARTSSSSGGFTQKEKGTSQKRMSRGWG